MAGKEDEIKGLLLNASWL